VLTECETTPELQVYCVAR